MSIKVISVFMLSANTVICALYIPPNLSTIDHRSSEEFLIAHIDFFVNHNPETNYISCGDFNDFDCSFIRSQLVCTNMVRQPTRASSILDQIWISEGLEDNYADEAIIGPPLGTSDHNSVFLPTRNKEKLSFPRVCDVYDYRHSHMAQFLNCLQTSDFSPVYCSSSLDGKCSAFYDIFNDAMLKIPKRTVAISNTDKPWMTPVLKSMIEDRWTAFRQRNWTMYNHLKEKVKTEICKAKDQWSKKVIEKGGNIWSLVHEISGKKNQCGFDRSLVKNLSPQDFLASLSDAFSENFNSDEDSELIILKDADWSPNITPENVFRQLIKLSDKKASGYDGLPCRLLRESAHLICDVLHHIFLSSIQERSFPAIWKTAVITPLPKVKTPSVRDFRPISLLPVIGKVFERLVLSHVKKDIIELYGDHQHAFRPLGSTSSALIEMHDTVTMMMEENDTYAVRITCLDLQKAFDKIHHNRIINYMHEKGINDGFLSWLHSFLTNRQQRVKFESMFGPIMNVRSGLPQGSVLGPFLCAAFLGSLQLKAPDVKLIKYADDMTLIERISCGNPNPRNLSILQRSIDNKHLIINCLKSKQIVVKRSRDFEPPIYPNIDVISSLSILGVAWNERLSWDQHFDNVCLTASRRLYVIRRMKHVISKKRLIEVYISFIMSVLLYATPLFCKLSYRNLYSVNKIEKRAHKFICGYDCKCDALPSFTERRLRLSLNLLRKCESVSHPLNSLTPDRLPRTNHFNLPYVRTTRRKNSFFPWICELQNDLL